ncbi:MAG: T9SS type A sorting domain-containing protein, partial [Candidatus Kapaibacterium sp.]
MKLFACHGTTIDTLLFNDDLRSQSFQMNLGYKIDSLKFDDDGLVLSQYVSASGDTSNTYDNSHSALLPNEPALAVRVVAPDNPLFNVSLNAEELLCKFSTTEQTGMIGLYNSIGIKIQEIAISAGESFKNLNISNLSSGVYFVRFTCGATNAIRRVNIVR